MELKELLRTAFNAGVNAGIIEAAHQLNMLKDNKEKTFDDFCKEPLIVSFLNVVVKPN